jgi:hypothetical protein
MSLIEESTRLLRLDVQYALDGVEDLYILWRKLESGFKFV